MQCHAEAEHEFRRPQFLLNQGRQRLEEDPEARREFAALNVKDKGRRPVKTEEASGD